MFRKGFEWWSENLMPDCCQDLEQLSGHCRAWNFLQNVIICQSGRHNSRIQQFLSQSPLEATSFAQFIFAPPQVSFDYQHCTLYYLANKDGQKNYKNYKVDNWVNQFHVNKLEPHTRSWVRVPIIFDKVWGSRGLVCNASYQVSHQSWTYRIHCS